MSRLFEALSGLTTEQQATEVVTPLTIALPTLKQDEKSEHHSLRLVQPTVGPLAVVQAEPEQEMNEANEVVPKPAETVETPAITVSASPESHLVAVSDPSSLGAEKFRALVTRFDHLRKQRELRSFQVTSSVINEGKTLVAGNVAVTLAKYSGSKTLLVEGDLHRPTLAHLFGLRELRGLNHWWSGQEKELGRFVYRLNGMPLWFLPAGKPCDQPSDLLRSARFMKAFKELAGQFEWIVVDSTPMLPIVDVNLWSRLVDGTLLVVREGIAPLKALKKGLQSLDHPKLIGVVVNEATEFDQVDYAGQYYGGSDRADKSAKKR
jgi:capsular exopolysaccharide synthesis family protein